MKKWKDCTNKISYSQLLKVLYFQTVTMYQINAKIQQDNYSVYK